MSQLTPYVHNITQFALSSNTHPVWKADSANHTYFPIAKGFSGVQDTSRAIESHNEAQYENHPMTNEEADEFLQMKTLGTIVAMLGVSGLVLPLVAAGFGSLSLLSPNLLLAKSLALLSIPVAALSYGRRRRRRRRSLQQSDASGIPSEFEEWLTTLEEMIDAENSRSQADINRQQHGKGLLFLKVPQRPSFLKTTTSEPILISEGGSVEDLTAEITDYSNDNTTLNSIVNASANGSYLPEQCLERIACEGFLQSIPKLFMNSFQRGQEVATRGRIQVVVSNLHNGKPSDRGTGKTMVRFKGGQHSNRRKNLAKYALNKLVNNGNKNRPQKSGPPPPLITPIDMEEWFVPPPPTTTTEVPPTSTTTTPEPDEPSIEVTELSTDGLMGSTESIVENNQNGNPCLKYRCSFMS